MVVLGVGNILMDIVVKIDDETLINKYHVQKDSQRELNKAEMRTLMDDISSLQMECRPGGAAQNTMRVLQWLFDAPKSTHMIGAIGKDEQGKRLKQLVEDDGVVTHFVEVNDEVTGKAIALILDQTRTLIANIGASMCIALDRIVGDVDIQETLAASKIIYMEGFFITDRFALAKYFVDYAATHGKAFVFNVSAPYLCEKYARDIVHFVTECDILFGNVNEFRALSESVGCQSLDSLFERLSKTYRNTKRMEYDKMIVMTNGSKNVTCFHSGGTKTVYDVPKIDKKEIGDTVGAGDSFVAGFLYALCKGNEPSRALAWGCRCAREIIKQSGCTVPKYRIDFP